MQYIIESNIVGEWACVRRGMGCGGAGRAEWIVDDEAVGVGVV